MKRELWTPHAPGSVLIPYRGQWVDSRRFSVVDGYVLPKVSGGAPPTVYGSFVTKLGVATEVTAGVAPNVNPTKWIPAAAPKPEDALKFYEDKAFRGLTAESFGHYQLVGQGQVDIDGPAYPDTLGYWLWGALGKDTQTAAPGATTTTGTNNAGQSLLTITSGTGYINGAAILIGAGTTLESNIIKSGGGTTTLTLVAPMRYTQTAGAAVTGGNVHLFQANAALTQPPTFTFWDFYGPNWRQYTFSMVEQFTFKWQADTEALYQTRLRTWLSTVPSTPGATSYAQVAPFMGWQAGFVNGGTGQLNLEDLELQFMRKIATPYGSANTQNPQSIFGATLRVTGRATLQVSTDAEYNLFRNATNPALQFALFGSAPGAVGSQAATGLYFQASQSAATKAPFERSKDYVQIKVEFTCDYNATDAGPAQVQLTNAVVGAYT